MLASFVFTYSENFVQLGRIDIGSGATSTATTTASASVAMLSKVLKRISSKEHVVSSLRGCIQKYK
jgi:hypothetical protein